MVLAGGVVLSCVVRPCVPCVSVGVCVRWVGGGWRVAGKACVHASVGVAVVGIVVGVWFRLYGVMKAVLLVWRRVGV